MKIVVLRICSKCWPWNIAGGSEEAGECYGETHRPLATGHDRLVGLIPQTDFRFALRALHRGNAAGDSGRMPGEAGSYAVAVVWGVGKAVKEAKEEQSGAVPALERVPAFSHRWARRRRVVRLSACAALLGRSARALLGWAPASASRWSYPPSPLARRPSSASCR